MMTVCDTKVTYENEWEATVASYRMSDKTEEEFIFYPCGNHYHISHADPSKRQGVGKGYWKCPDCKEIMKKARSRFHHCKRYVQGV